MTDPLRGVDQLSTQELLGLYGGILDELHARGVVRSRNAPAGDLAETLSALAYRGSLAPASAKSWDVLAGDGRKIQVKCRVSHPTRRGGSFSPFRSDGFDACVFVVLACDYEVSSAIEVPMAGVFQIAQNAAWVNGVRVRVGHDLIAVAGAVNLTAAFLDAMATVNASSSGHPLATRGR